MEVSAVSENGAGLVVGGGAPVTASQIFDEIQTRKELVDIAIADLRDAVKEKLEAEAAYDMAEAMARIKSVTEDDTRREADHKAQVTKATALEKAQKQLKTEMLKVSYKVLDARCSQLSSTQTQSKIYEREMKFVQTGPEF
jgi:hypothetical protein